MKKIYQSFALLFVIMTGTSFCVFGQTTTFNYTGGIQNYTVPPGVIQLAITATGATGGFDAQQGLTMSDRFGYGACVVCTLSVVSGTILDIYVGGMGGNGTTTVGGAGGFNGGGQGSVGYSPYAGGGGGGASDIRVPPYALANREVIAAGGGGAGGDYFLPLIDYERGGDGGGLTGEAGHYDNIVGYAYAGGGGGPLTGGVAGVYSGWTSGSAGVSGIGGAAGGGGGGGGGGYFGGGGGSWGGGGGGSSYTDPVLATAVVHTRGCNTGSTGTVPTNGNVTITPVGCVPPVSGAIVGPSSICAGIATLYTDPTGSAGGTWSSPDPTVTVGSSTGIVTGLTAGTATISYSLVLTCGSAFATTVITIMPSPAPITGLANICKGSTSLLGETVLGGAWSSSSTTIAPVGSSNGVVSGLALGSATITYTLGTCIATYAVTVNPVPLPIVGANYLCQHLSTTFTDPTAGGTWQSGSPTVALAGSLSGVISGLGTSGVAAITYTLPDGCSVTHYITVNTPPAPITGYPQICTYGTTNLSEAIGGGTWNSGTPGVATVNTTGYVQGEIAGTTIVSYTIVGCPPAQYTITVNPTPVPISGMTSICSGITTSLYDSSLGGTWSSSDTTVATVSSSGIVTCIDSTVGLMTTITYTLPSTCLTTLTVSVHTAPTSIYGYDSVCKGASTTLYDTTIGGVWSSTSLAAAPVVDSSGVVTGLIPGWVTISYTLPSGCYSAYPFYVKPLIPASVNITATPGDSVCAGTPIVFTATPVNGGTPTFDWKVFLLGTPTDSIGTTFTYTPIHGDVIVCEMVTHGICSVSDTVVDTYAVNVYPTVTPSINIVTNATSTIAGYYGQMFTFFSNVSYGGASPTFQWYKNGVAISGATGRSCSVPVYENDTFTCMVTGIPPCDNSTITAMSNSIVILATYLNVPVVAATVSDLKLFPNPNNGGFTISGDIDASINSEIQLEITDMLGQVVFTGKTMPQNGRINEQILLGNGIAEGSYLLHLSSGSLNQVIHFAINK